MIINYRNENVVKKVREYGKAIYESDLLNVIGADVPRNKLDEIKRIDGVEKVSFPRKADILN